jgi:hypothetical protein
MLGKLPEVLFIFPRQDEGRFPIAQITSLLPLFLLGFPRLGGFELLQRIERLASVDH